VPVGLFLLAACSRPAPSPAASTPLAVRYDQHVFAGGVAPPGDSAVNPFHGDAKSAKEGESLFSAMNCDGCHGGGATGWVAPALNDGRWRYGGSDAAIYQSIFYGRPKGMPAFGGLLAPPLIWKLASYVQSLPPGKAVPTQSW
jgi:cytochrome c oxidase cbb3-type subunit III